MIRIRNLGKKFRLGETHAQSLRDLINSAASWCLGRTACNPTSALPRYPGKQDRFDEAGEFWALKDISFDIQPGEVVGVIGRNGAGKSTLLKVLSSIVAPTTGRIELAGRVASLLEVGTGFHPELTGRENVFLNGTILGMTKSQVRRQFDEIVAFAGVDAFIDTPVKRYSSGMTVRLAFAVAAFLESEILIIDEVLAVGDVEFQRKCLGRMQTVSESGRTVLFVSHNMPSVRALTTRSIVLSHGRLRFDGLTSEAIDCYIEENALARDSGGSVADRERPYDGLTGEVQFELVEVGQPDPYTEGSAVAIEIGVRSQREADEFLVGLTIFRADDSPVGSCFSTALQPPAVGSSVRYRMLLPTEQLAPGRYHCAISLGEARSHGLRLLDSLSDVLAFEIEPGILQSQGWPAVWGPMRLAEMRLLSQSPETRQSNTASVTPVL